jgi:2-oxo-4-hydroxy-4-carboxy--5-ureidoimidazoline (OHCU) decarboxylase
MPQRDGTTITEESRQEQGCAGPSTLTPDERASSSSLFSKAEILLLL